MAVTMASKTGAMAIFRGLAGAALAYQVALLAIPRERPVPNAVARETYLAYRLTARVARTRGVGCGAGRDHGLKLQSRSGKTGPLKHGSPVRSKTDLRAASLNRLHDPTADPVKVGTNGEDRAPSQLSS